jgi:hypothetical protein
MSQFGTLATAVAACGARRPMLADGPADGATDGAEAIPLADAASDGVAEALAETDAEAPGDELPPAG